MWSIFKSFAWNLDDITCGEAENEIRNNNWKKILWNYQVWIFISVLEVCDSSLGGIVML